MVELLASDRASLIAQIEQLRNEVSNLRARAERAEALADHDVLTPTLNRRGFLDNLTRVMAYCRRHKLDAALLYLDLDDFKKINDCHGHPAGDAALIAVANLLLAGVRESDAVGRMGGDEFCVLLIDANMEAARHKADELAKRLDEGGFIWGDRRYSLSGSIGLKPLSDQPDPETWVAEADAAMWLRKGADLAAR
ncbi:GGDEF domain-containing protein [Brevundimonas pishanensis]|uniref:GGDEF domain-containing protein n=1 Tax=Brevundimonas pishanensis TaxID=2896315 RepID=UPI001FA7555A|nr:GGDEF domain-containing protein [Brevundimonas pishanensis]